MTSLTLTSTTTAVTLETVETVTQAVSKNVTVYTFGDGSEELLDDGKSNHSIVVGGYDKTNPKNRIRWVNTIMDSMEEVAVTGFEDTNFNTDYIITDLQYNQETGEGAIPLYHFTITLEKLRDDV